MNQIKLATATKASFTFLITMFGTVVHWNESTGQGQIRAYGGSPRPLFLASSINRNDFPTTLTIGQLVMFEFNALTDEVANVRNLRYQRQL